MMRTWNAEEPVLHETTIDGMVVRRMPDDLLAIRISLGEVQRASVPGTPAYCVYRGDLDAVVMLLHRAAVALEQQIAARDEMPRDDESPGGQESQ